MRSGGRARGRSVATGKRQKSLDPGAGRHPATLNFRCQATRVGSTRSLSFLGYPCSFTAFIMQRATLSK